MNKVTPDTRNARLPQCVHRSVPECGSEAPLIRDYRPCHYRPAPADGVPVSAIPRTDSRFESEGLIRDFDVAGRGWLPRLRQSSLNHCLLVLGTAKSTRSAWLRAGEALQRILLEATRLNFVVSLASQVSEVPSTRDRLRKELGLEFHPLLLMRIGRAAPTPASQRRHLNVIISETGD